MLAYLAGSMNKQTLLWIANRCLPRDLIRSGQFESTWYGSWRNFSRHRLMDNDAIDIRLGLIEQKYVNSSRNNFRRLDAALGTEISRTHEKTKFSENAQSNIADNGQRLT